MQNKQLTGFFTHDLALKYDQGQMSPENAIRIQSIIDQLLISGLSGYLSPAYAQEAVLEDVLRVHTFDYVKSLKTTEQKTLSQDTQLNAYSWSAAMKSVGAAIEAVRAVVTGQYHNAFVCVRPPGHHAGRDFGHGYCLLNSVACAAVHALDVLGLKRVAIVDFDVHRADGTEDCVANDSRIALFNCYQQSAFPQNVPDATASNIHNAPLADGATGDDVLHLFKQDWLHQLLSFQPELILISAGFDAHREEDQALLKLTEIDYAWITELLLRVAGQTAQGRLVSILEGGYNTRSLARSVLVHVRALVNAAIQVKPT